MRCAVPCLAGVHTVRIAQRGYELDLKRRVEAGKKDTHTHRQIPMYEQCNLGCIRGNEERENNPFYLDETSCVLSPVSAKTSIFVPLTAVRCSAMQSKQLRQRIDRIVACAAVLPVGVRFLALGGLSRGCACVCTPRAIHTPAIRQPYGHEPVIHTCIRQLWDGQSRRSCEQGDELGHGCLSGAKGWKSSRVVTGCLMKLLDKAVSLRAWVSWWYRYLSMVGSR